MKTDAAKKLVRSLDDHRLQGRAFLDHFQAKLSDRDSLQERLKRDLLMDMARNMVEKGFVTIEHEHTDRFVGQIIRGDVIVFKTSEFKEFLAEFEEEVIKEIEERRFDLKWGGLDS